MTDTLSFASSWCSGTRPRASRVRAAGTNRTYPLLLRAAVGGQRRSAAGGREADGERERVYRIASYRPGTKQPSQARNRMRGGYGRRGAGPTCHRTKTPPPCRPWPCRRGPSALRGSARAPRVLYEGECTAGWCGGRGGGVRGEGGGALAPKEAASGPSPLRRGALHRCPRPFLALEPQRLRPGKARENVSSRGCRSRDRHGMQGAGHATATA